MNEAHVWIEKAQKRPRHVSGEVEANLTDAGHCHIRALTDRYGPLGELVVSGAQACELARWIFQVYGKV